MFSISFILTAITCDFILRVITNNYYSAFVMRSDKLFKVILTDLVKKNATPTRDVYGLSQYHVHIICILNNLFYVFNSKLL